MIIFLYGPDTYRSKQKLNNLKEEFIKRKDKKGLNVSVIEAKCLTLDELRKSFLSAGLFSEKRLLIIKNILSEKPAKKDEKAKEKLFEEIIKILKKSKKDEDLPTGQAGNILIFWDEKINEKQLNSSQKPLYQLLKKEKYAEEFETLGLPEIKKWVRKQISQQGFQIQDQALDLLINTFGNNLWLFKNELEKLMAWELSEEKKEINLSDVQKIISPKFEQDIWQLVDCLGQKNKTRALKILSDQFKQNVDVSQIISLLAHQYRTIFRIKSYLETHRINNHYQLSKIIGLHPFVCQKGLAQEKNYSLGELKKTYQQLLKIDLLRKTKRIDSETLLDLLIIKS